MVASAIGRFMLGVDTVKLTLTGDECREDFMRKVPPLLEGRHWKQSICQGQAYEQESGWLGNMFVRVGSWGTVVEGSLARYFLGNNLQTLTRGDVRDAVEGKLSDELHLPMGMARVGRLDVGTNLLTKYAPYMYIQCLGPLARFERLEQQHGLLYKATSREVCIYDKIRQVEREGGIVPEPYVGSNALRIEKRHLKLTKPALRKFGLSRLTGATLYNEDFYKDIMKDFVKTYDSITKIQKSPQKIEVEMETMTEWNTLGRLLIIKEMGGMSGFMRWLEERQRRGLMTAKQKCDFTKGAKK
ncbi:MAG: hypothetical protein LUD72_05405, partial [Bacteroidales bacterium]|nr:hypothetical protein [Bacteroidales bacterium]